MNKKRIAVLLIAVVVTVPVLGNAVQVSAAEATQSVQTVQTDAASQQAKKLLNVAKGELGYKEAKDGTTKYGKWYGIPKGAWCAMFVSWCANKAGISTKVIPKFASCSVGIQWFKDHSVWKGKNYTPKTGDLIFFTYGHVGIVNYVETTKNKAGKTIKIVHTIEGNTSDMVAERKHTVGDSNISGYGVPQYNK